MQNEKDKLMNSVNKQEYHKIKNLYDKRNDLKNVIFALKKLRNDLGYESESASLLTGTETTMIGKGCGLGSLEVHQSLLDYLETTPAELSGFVAEAEDIVFSLRCLLLGEETNDKA